MPTNSLTVRVTDYIFDYIRSRRLTSGHPLPSELKTSTELGVSRGIVREAFRSLELAGIIEKANGRSPRVGVLDSSFLTNLMVNALSTRQVSVVQVLEVRASIEVHAAELACSRRTPFHVQGLQAAADGMLASLQEPDAFVHHDLAFHGLIYGATGNPLFEIICGAMYGAIQESMRVGFLKRSGASDVARVAKLHGRIAGAIEKGETSRAGELMRLHFEDTRQMFEKLGIE
ncbi:MAG: FadR/GntR family transcriptional regulator [Acidobacteriota bacterium]